MEVIDIYTDGSWTPDRAGETRGAGCVIINGKLVSVQEFVSTDGTLVSGRQITGEIFPCLYLLSFIGDIIADGLDKRSWQITIHYDYEGVEKWVTGVWSTKRSYTAIYAKRARAVIKSIQECGGNVTFHHVKGHSGVAWNEVADVVAKCGIKAADPYVQEMYDGKIEFRMKDSVCSDVEYTEVQT